MLRSFIKSKIVNISSLFKWSFESPFTSVASRSPHLHIAAVVERVKVFSDREGRQPRMMLAQLHSDENVPSTMCMATGFADIGFDVDVSPPHHTPVEVAQHAADADVHVVGVSLVDMARLSDCKALIDHLGKLGRSDIIVIASGVIQEKHHSQLFSVGVTAIVNSDESLLETVMKILDEIENAVATEATN